MAVVQRAPVLRPQQQRVGIVAEAVGGDVQRVLRAMPEHETDSQNLRRTMNFTPCSIRYSAPCRARQLLRYIRHGTGHSCAHLQDADADDSEVDGRHPPQAVGAAWQSAGRRSTAR